MKNNLVLILLFLPVFILGGVISYYDYSTHFSRVEIVVEGYDPKDFFSGYYMELQPNWAKTDCTQFAEQKCPTEAFQQRYKYYINRTQSDKLTKAVNAGSVKLAFSYAEGRTPYIVDLLIDGKSYMEYISEENSPANVRESVRQRVVAHPPHHQKKNIPARGRTFHHGIEPSE